MAFTAFRDMKPLSQLVFSAFIILLSFIAFMVLAFVVAIPVFGMDTVLNMGGLSDFDNPQTLILLKYFQTIQAIGLFIVPPFILAYLFHGNMGQYLYFNRSFNSSTILLVIILMFFMAPFINFMGEMNSSMSFPSWLSGLEQWMKDAEENAAAITEAFLNVSTFSGLAFNIFMIALLPALGEELLFRGVIQKIFTNITKNHHWGIWISALLFSAMHVQFYGFVPRAILGALFGYLLVWSGSMWLPILAHFLNNAIAVIALYFINNNMLNPEYEEIGTTNESYYMAALSLVLTVLFLLMIKRQNSGNQIALEVK